MSLDDLRSKFWIVGRRYALTINPNNKYQYYCKTNRLDLFKRYVNEVLFKDFTGLYHCVIELSEPIGDITVAPRLHIHGYILFQNKSELGTFMLHTLPQWVNSNHVHIVPMGRYSDMWYYYMHKQNILSTKYSCISNIHLCDKCFEWFNTDLIE